MIDNSPFNPSNLPSEIYEEIRVNWLMDREIQDFPISINQSRLIYKMTLGSVFYSLDEGRLIKKEAQEPHTERALITRLFLERHYPHLYSKWNIIKTETNDHLHDVFIFLNSSIINSVDEILNQLEQEYRLTDYRSDTQQNEYFVRSNILETLYQEIQHYSALGYKLNFFKIDDSGRKVGNANVFLISSNEKLLSQFVHSINNIINDEEILSKFRNLETKKLKVEEKVFLFKKDLEKLHFKCY